MKFRAVKAIPVLCSGHHLLTHSAFKVHASCYVSIDVASKPYVASLSLRWDSASSCKLVVRFNVEGWLCAEEDDREIFARIKI